MRASPRSACSSSCSVDLLLLQPERKPLLLLGFKTRNERFCEHTIRLNSEIHISPIKHLQELQQICSEAQKANDKIVFVVIR